MAAKKSKGGRDQLCKWAKTEFPENPEIQKLASGGPAVGEAVFDNKTPGTALCRTKDVVSSRAMKDVRLRINRGSLTDPDFMF